MGQLLVPALIGAGVGAVGGAAMGKNPFKTALLGAGLGAGGAGLLGAGGAASATGATGVVGTTGEVGGALLSTAGGVGVPSATAGATSGGLGNFLSGIKGVETAPVNFGTGGYASGIGGQVINNTAPVAGIVGNGEIGSSLLTNSKGIPLNMMDKFGNYISNLPSQAMDWAKNNPISATKMAVDVATPAPEQPMQASQGQMRQGNLDTLYMPQWNTNVSSPTYNTSPNILPQQDNKTGLLSSLQSRIPLTDEEKLKLMQLGQRF